MLYVPSCQDTAYVSIRLDFETNNDLIDLLLMVDAIRRAYKVMQLRLVMPYLPYARQDRVCNPGESLSLKVVADLINSCKFDEVECWDIHSEVGVALLDNLKHRDNVNCGWRLPGLHSIADTVLVSPDAGANKKVFNFAKAHGYEHVVRADKLRDTKTGNILGTTVYTEHVGHKNFLILDDICDGGRTFIELAKVLEDLTDGNIYLYVTHGIFSQGLQPLAPYIDHIYTANLINPKAASSPILTQL